MEGIREILERFEEGLDPRRPEAGAVPAEVLGYGEISTVFAVKAPGFEKRALKRLSLFRNREEAEAYALLHALHVEILREAGLRLPSKETLVLPRPRRGVWTVYILEERVPAASLGHRLLGRLSAEEARRLVAAVLGEAGRVFAANAARRRGIEVGLDGQISNWSVQGVEAENRRLPDRISLLYLDTSTPLTRVEGKERLDPELFLRTAPFFLVWILRRFFLREVLDRYYDPRQVTLDLFANFFKEGRGDLVEPLLSEGNAFLRTLPGSLEPLTPREVRTYYRRDAWIWRLFLAFRRFDRALHRLSGRPYPHVLPGKIRR